MPVTVISPKVTCRAMVYVDDIIGAGSKRMIENIGRNLRQMEETKKFTFNLDKSKYLVINTGKGKEDKITNRNRGNIIPEKAENDKIKTFKGKV